MSSTKGTKRKLPDETQSPGAGPSKKIASDSSSPTPIGVSQGHMEGEKPKKKKQKAADKASVFAFDSGDLKTRTRPVSVNVCQGFGGTPAVHQYTMLNDNI